MLRSVRLADHMSEPPEGFENLTAYDALPYLWDSLLARPEQKQPTGDWAVWNYIAGRGTGKTRTGSETTIEALLKLGRRLVQRSPRQPRHVLVRGGGAGSHVRPG